MEIFFFISFILELHMNILVSLYVRTNLLDVQTYSNIYIDSAVVVNSVVAVDAVVNLLYLLHETYIFRT